MSTSSRMPAVAAALKVLGPFLIFFNTWGLLLSFGVFQAFYEKSILKTFSPSVISWIGTLSIFLLLVCGVIVGPIYDQGHQRSLIITGHILTLLGIFMLSLSTQLYQIFLTQGVCFGLGAGLLYIPSLAGVSRSFSRHRTLAIGIAMSGASVGGIAFSIALEQLLLHLSFGWAIRTIGFVILVTSTITLAIMLPEPVYEASTTRALLDFDAFRNVPFMLFSVGGLFVLLAYYLPFIYIPTVANRVGVNGGLQLYLLAIVNAASLLGRIVPAWAADTFGVLRSLPIAQACAAVVLFCWPAVTTVSGLVVWSCFWGFFSGMLIVMPGAALPHLAPSMTVIGTWMGMAWTISAVGFLIGGPIGGAIVADGSLIGMQMLAGTSMLCGAALCGGAGYLKLRQKRTLPQGNSSKSTCDDVDMKALEVETNLPQKH